jgi:hypothetical protein
MRAHSVSHNTDTARLLNPVSGITRATPALRGLLAVRKEPFEGRADSVFAPVALILVQTIFWRMLAERAQEHGYSNCGGASGGGEVEVGVKGT